MRAESLSGLGGARRRAWGIERAEPRRECASGLVRQRRLTHGHDLDSSKGLELFEEVA